MIRIIYYPHTKFRLFSRLSFLCSTLLTFLVFISACKKEYSYEGGSLEIANGSMLCDTSRIAGSYVFNKALDDSNTISVTLNISAIGKYKIYTDTVDGLSFSDSGYINEKGLQQVKLKPHGKFTAVTSWKFTVYFGNTTCDVIVLPPIADYLLNVSNNACDGELIFGSYKAGVPVSESDSVRMEVNVKSGGVYSIQTSTINGFSYYSNGIFTNAGVQNIVLRAHGTPSYGGETNFPLIVSSSSCSFTVNVDYKSIDTSMYYSFEVDGKKISGYLDSARFSKQSFPSLDLYAVSVQTVLTSPEDTMFTFIFSRINNNITAGTYHSSLLGDEDFECGMDYSAPLTYIYAASRFMPEFKMNLTDYTIAGKLVKGNFSGPLSSNQGDTAQVKNGVFKTYLAH